MKEWRKPFKIMCYALDIFTLCSFEHGTPVRCNCPETEANLNTNALFLPVSH
jgi:hypothetical protein